MIKTFVVATCLALGAGTDSIAGSVPFDPHFENAITPDGTVQNRLAANRLATNRLATNRLATNRLATNRLATNGLPLAGLSLTPTGAGDVTPLVAVVAVTLADGTRIEVPARR